MINLVHVYPVNDIEDHETEVNDIVCKCGPVLEDGVIIHNAFDGRDIIEEIENNKTP